MTSLIRFTAGFVAIGAIAFAHATEVRVTVTNLAPTQGTFLTPVWFGFHNGGFDIYDNGTPSSMGLERIAEDGSVGPIGSAFTASGFGEAQGVLNGLGPIGPGASTSKTATISLAGRFFSYASMVIPSNDAFIANGNPLAFDLFDGVGNFVGADFVVLGSNVLDAGTEVNDEIPANTAFFGQATPNTGADENGVVRLHPGFNPVGSGGILDSSMFANADFHQTGYQIARIQVEVVPEPATVVCMAIGLAGLVSRRRKHARPPLA